MASVEEVVVVMAAVSAEALAAVMVAETVEVVMEAVPAGAATEEVVTAAVARAAETGERRSPRPRSNALRADLSSRRIDSPLHSLHGQRHASRE